MTAADHRSGSLARSHAIAKLPAQDLERARACLSRPARSRTGRGARARVALLLPAGQFHVFLSSGRASGASTQLGFEVEDIDATVAELRERGGIFERFDAPGFKVIDGIVDVGNNYPTKGTGERGAWFRDSEGNLLGLGQATR